MTRVALFAAVLAAAFVAAVGLGRAVGPLERRAEPSAHGHETSLRFAAERTTLRSGRVANFAFSIADGEDSLETFDVAHARRMHLIVVSRDLSDFQHLHPTLGDRGIWKTQLRLPRPGAYRAFADFSTGGERSIVASDLYAPGAGVTRPLPPVAAETEVDGYRVALHRHGDMLEFDVTRNGRPVHAQPYLGAAGHLVVLREGDLEYLHTHPHGHELAFEVEFPSAARYRAFVQFRAGGAVHTAAFTVEERA